MKNISDENLIQKIPQLFSVDITMNNCEVFFEKIKNIVSFEHYYLFLLNSEDIQLKSTNDNNFKINDIFEINSSLSQRLFLNKSEILDKKADLARLLDLNDNSYLISKLRIKNTIYGFVLLSNKNEYNDTDIENFEAIASVLSYKIKDLELSNVFKIQLKALKNAVEETNEAYKTIKSQNKKILAADKIKNEFLASVSHELRTPLNAIIGFSDILKAQVYGKLTDKQQEFVNDIQVSGVQLLGMVNEILDITKLEANAMKLVKRYFEISRPIIETSNLLMPLINKKNIKLTQNIQNDIDIYADYQKIQQVLYNLISNAIKYTPENGTIDITVTNTSKKFKISVKDSGIGIDPKDHKKIFQKFVQLEDAFYKKETSTGLGLTITMQLVKMHKGSIKIVSEKGKGAEFIVTLPIEIDDEPQA